ncbi:hypothetical protein E4T56_gene9377 [Termitomyces sp. T112]|nr:hypothetical protein E4T56_gene9377 [Termitomyces sp. T112]
MLRWCKPAGHGSAFIHGSSYYPKLQTSRILLRRELHADSSKSITQKAISFLYCTYVTRRISGYLGEPSDKLSTKHDTFSELDSAIIEPPSPTSSSTAENSSLKAFTALSNFLSCRNATSHPKKQSLDTLRLLYSSVKTQGQLHLFSPKQLTELISLFGTLSLPDSRNGLIYLSKLASYVTPEGNDEEQWDFLIEVARDKQKTLKMKLNGTDGFWLMRALLTKVVLSEGETSLMPGDPREQALSEATQHYLRIWRHAYDVEIHLPLLQKWFDLGTPKETAALVNRLCRVLELHIYPNSRLIEVFWRLILRRTLPLVPDLKARILAMVNKRLSPQFAETCPAHKKKRNSKFVPAPSPLSERHLGTPELSNALGTALFPTCAVQGSRDDSCDINHWATEQARQAFAPAVAQDVQWGNLLLLAIHQSERLNLPPSLAQAKTKEDTSAAPETNEEAIGDWRPVLVLNALERETGGAEGGRILAPNTRMSVQGIMRPLWRMWKAGDDGTRSVNVATSRPIAAAFFRLAAKVVDGPLTDACYRFCVKHDLFRGGEKLAAEAMHNWADLNAAYVLAVAACRGVGWETAFEETQISGNRDLVLTTLFFHYVLTDLRVGFQVYRYAVQRGYKLGERPVHMMGMKLATPRTWQLAVPLLERPAMSRRRQEELLIAILRVLQAERRQYVDPKIAKILGDALWRLYENTAPPNKFKYPIRFFFSIMIASEQPARAIAIVEVIHRNAPPSFFTTRLLLRLMRTLVRYRHIHLTHRVHRLVPTDPANARAAADFRRKMTLSLARAGAHTAAKRAYGYGLDLKKDQVWRTPREAMTRAVKFNTRTPLAKHTLPIMSILSRAPTHRPTIQYAATLLVRAHRPSAVRKVLERSLPHLDSKTMATIGNTILDGLLTRHVLRNGRLVRHILRTKEQMEKTYGFKPDRVTINITIKSLLRWRVVFDSSKIRELFDHIVRCGYPASEQWMTPGTDVPFGTSTVSMKIPAANEKIVFEKHVRPLYKMFIKALFTRGDGPAARKVVGILREEEGRAVMKKQEWNQARWDGVQRKKLGTVKSREKD